jgi:hypothetical protein
MRVLLLIVTILGISAERADACACCDAQHDKKVVGWSDAGGAVLIEANTRGCEPTSVLMVYPLGVKEPSGCYDLLSAPDKRVACADIKPDEDGKAKAKKSKIPKQFGKPATQLEAARIKLHSKLEKPDEIAKRTKVEVDGKLVLNELFEDASHVDKVTAWPNARGDRALLLIEYTEHGTNNQQVAVRWIELPKKP